MAKHFKIIKDLSYRSPKSHVQESPIHDKGLFAKQAIAAREIVAVKGGYILTKRERTTLERQIGQVKSGVRALKLEDIE